MSMPQVHIVAYCSDLGYGAARGAEMLSLMLGAVIMCTLLGMALGGWMSGKVFDLTGSYQAAFVNGLAWNFVNLAIAFLLWRGTKPGRLRIRSPQPASWGR